MNNKIVLCSVLLASWILSPSMADNWAHWRGSTGNGVAVNARPPLHWDSTKNVTWKVAVPGHGSASPVIWQDRVFVVTAVPVAGEGGGRRLPKLEFLVLCYDRGDGHLLWQQTATVATPHEAKQVTNSFASASPCTDGSHGPRIAMRPTSRRHCSREDVFTSTKVRPAC